VPGARPGGAQAKEEEGRGERKEGKRKKNGKEKKRRRKTGKEIGKRFRKLGKLLGNLGERILRGFSGVKVIFGTMMRARRTGRWDRGGAGFPAWWPTAALERHA
jgi:hypothetical protein